jgi:hypothetical protein
VHRITLVAGEEVEGLEVDRIWSHAGFPRGQRACQERVDLVAGVVGHVVAGEHAGKSTGERERIPRAPQRGSARDRDGVADEPSAALVAGLELELEFVEQVDRGDTPGGPRRDALQASEIAVFPRETREPQPRVAARGAVEHDGGGGERLRGHR